MRIITFIVLLAASVSTAFAQTAASVRFRLPLEVDSPRHYFFDDDPEPSVCLSWNCKTSDDLDCVNGIEDHTYDGHPGTDFSFGGVKGAAVLAAADGTLIETEDGHGDGCSPCTCAACVGHPNGNFVRLDHGDGVTTAYLHLEAGSPTSKPIGSFISCGEVIGSVGTSGQSTGPHLHFDVQNNYTQIDPYASTGVTYDPQTATCRIDQRVWVDQCEGSPSPRCDTVTELIRNGGFAIDPQQSESAWRHFGDFHFDMGDYRTCRNRCEQCAKTCPGFAYLGNEDGSLGNVAGVLEQDVSIPAGSRWATLVYWYTLEAETQTPGSPVVWVQIKDESGMILQTLRAYANASSDLTDGAYKREAFDLSSYAGQTIRLSVSGDTTQIAPSRFRLDSVSLKAGVEGPVTSECGDGDPCTAHDRCVDCAGTQKCAGTPIACNNGLFCDGIETCVAGTCVAGSSPCPLGTWCQEQARQCAMLGDYDGDGDVDLRDIGGFLTCFLRPGSGDCAAGDLAGDGVVGLADFKQFGLRGLESLRLRILIQGDGESSSYGLVAMNTPENKTCPPDCTYALDDGTPVGLTASVLPAGPEACDGNPFITFKGWSISGVAPGSGCDGSGDPQCSFTMTGNATVTALFDDSRVVPLTIAPKLLIVDIHDEGYTAVSNKSRITNNSLIGTPPARVCVQSFTSLVPPYRTIDQVVDGADNGSDSRVKCVFNNGHEETVEDCLSGNACTEIESGASATFWVLMPVLVENGPRFLRNSSYNIILSAGQAETYTLKFKYEAGDIIP